jgi:transcriptional regulator with XRE-family HTH domain
VALKLSQADFFSVSKWIQKLYGCTIISMSKVTPNFKKERPTYYFKQWRKYRGLTQEMLAERIHATASTISQLETGKQGFTNSTLEALAEALNCQPGDLLMRDPLKVDAIWSIQDQFLKATPDQQKQIVYLVDVILKTGTDG